MKESNSIGLIPNAEHAVVDIRKLRDYCLNLEHSTGKIKFTPNGVTVTVSESHRR